MRAWIAVLAVAGLMAALSGCSDKSEADKLPKWARGDGRPKPAPVDAPAPADAKPEEAKTEPKPDAVADAKPEAKPDPEPEEPQQMPDGVVLPDTDQTFDPQQAESASMTKLKAIALGMRKYQGLSKEKTLPPHARYDQDDQQALLSWRVLVLPYVGQSPLFKQFHLKEAWDSPHNQKLLAQMPDIYKTPGVTRAGYTAYVVPRGQGTIFAQHKGLTDKEIGDGLDRTILVLETLPDKAVPWTKPEDFTLIPAKPSAGLTTDDKSEFLAAMANTVVHRIPLSLDDDFLLALFTANGHESLNMAVLDEKNAGKVHSGPLGEAEKLLAKDNARDALNPLYVEGIARANPLVLNTLRWSPGLKRSLLMVRVGLAVQLPGGAAAQAGQQAAQSWNEQVGKPLQEKLRGHMVKGDFGRWLQLTPAAAQTQDQPQPDPNSPEGAKLGTGGVVFLGTGELGPLRKVAQKEGVDVLVYVIITTRAIRSRNAGGEQFNSSLVVKVWDVAKNELLWTSKTINSAPPPGTPVPRAARTALKKEDTPEQQVKNLLSDFDAVFNEKINLTDMPELSGDDLQKRIEELSTATAPNPLSALLELRYDEFKKLVTRDDLIKVYSQLVGEENGPRLATGNQQERRQILSKWTSKE